MESPLSLLSSRKLKDFTFPDVVYFLHISLKTLGEPTHLLDSIKNTHITGKDILFSFRSGSFKSLFPDPRIRKAFSWACIQCDFDTVYRYSAKIRTQKPKSSLLLFAESTSTFFVQ